MNTNHASSVGISPQNPDSLRQHQEQFLCDQFINLSELVSS